MCVVCTTADSFQQADVSHKTGKKMAEYLNLGHGAAPTILTIRDTDAFRPGHNGDNHVSVETASGRRKVTPADYVAAVNKLRPDVVVSMAHEVSTATGRHHVAAASPPSSRAAGARHSQAQARATH